MTTGHTVVARPLLGPCGEGDKRRPTYAQILLLLILIPVCPAFAQVDGHASVMFDLLPDASQVPGSQTVSELRARVFVERRNSFGQHLRLNLSAYVDGLLADRDMTGDASARHAIIRPGDLYLDFVSERFELRGGMSRLVWGRLDEFQPTDVVNPIDLTRFLLEGRSEARLPVALIRGRLFLPHSSTLEGVVVPVFRPGRFDQLEEQTSPFNLLAVSGVDVHRKEPEFRAANMQGGARFTSTAGRVDWAMVAYRGFRPFPTLTLVPTFAPPPLVVETFPRFTMLGGDFETVHGSWGVRGEIAAFVHDELQSTRLGRGVPGRTIDAGLGADRKAGSYRIAANLLWSMRRIVSDDLPAGDQGPSEGRPLGDPGVAIAREELNRSDLNLVLAAERTFARETRNVRVFAVYDPVDRTTFTRLIAAISLRDDVWLEGSGGLFSGSADDTLGRLANRDFVYARLKVFF
jgi:hypothetical protein